MPSNPSPTRNRAASAAHYRIRPTTGRGGHYGIVWSALFHGAIFAAAYITFQRNFTAPEETHMVPVDLVTIAATTNVAAQAPPAEKFTPPPPSPPLPDEPPPEPQMQDVEPAPLPPVPKFDIAKEKPVEKAVEKPAEKPKPAADDTPKPPGKKQQKEDFASLLDKLTAPEAPVKHVKAGPRVIQGVGAGSAMTANLADALRSQIYRCWSPPIGAPDPNDLVVDYSLSLNRDGTVRSAQLQTLGGNSYTRAAAEAASRAIYQCQPYRLPPDSYDDWREISRLRFDPRALEQ